ncbi:H(+)-transporting V1 sector ATPase subunit A [Gryganskiella cystojenkinii]|nr:H(+)-transporting V1 sector ATPase subunit A [Gryganskiella cystojenkinii]
MSNKRKNASEEEDTKVTKPKTITDYFHTLTNQAQSQSHSHIPSRAKDMIKSQNNSAFEPTTKVQTSSTKTNNRHGQDTMPLVSKGGYEPTIKFLTAFGDPQEIQHLRPGDWLLDKSSQPVLIESVEPSYGDLYLVREHRTDKNNRTAEELGLVEFLSMASNPSPSYESQHRSKFVVGWIEWCDNKKRVVARATSFLTEKERDKRYDDLSATQGDDILWSVKAKDWSQVASNIRYESFLVKYPLLAGSGRFRQEVSKAGLPLGMALELAKFAGIHVGDGYCKSPQIAVDLRDKDSITWMLDTLKSLGLYGTLERDGQGSLGMGDNLDTFDEEILSVLKGKDVGQGNGGSLKYSGIPNVACSKVKSNTLWWLLVELGLTGRKNKNVPEWLYLDDIDVRSWFMSGYIEADGCVRRAIAAHKSTESNANPSNLPEVTDYDVSKVRGITKEDQLLASASYSQASFTSVDSAVATNACLTFSSLGVRSGVHCQDEREVKIQGKICRSQFTYGGFLTPSSALSEVLSHCSIERKRIEPGRVQRLPIKMGFSVRPLGLSTTIERLSREETSIEQDQEHLSDQLLVLNKTQAGAVKDDHLNQKADLVNRLPFEVVQGIAARFERKLISDRNLVVTKTGVSNASVSSYLRGISKIDKVHMIYKRAIQVRMSLEALKEIKEAHKQQKQLCFSLTVQDKADPVVLLANLTAAFTN